MRKVSDTTFLLVGAGGLGSPVLCALAAARAGRIVIVDDDVVDLSNLQRQILFRTVDVGQKKALLAKAALVRRGFPPRRIEAVTARFDEDSAAALCHDADVVLDGSDNLHTKFLVNDLCVEKGLPFVIAAVLRRAGQVFPVRPGRDACYRCLFEKAPDEDLATCADAGVFGATCGEVGALQARAALALASGDDPEGLLGRIWLKDASASRSIQVERRPDCPACAAREASQEAFQEVSP